VHAHHPRNRRDIRRPETVLSAARDFSERRAVLWPNVKLAHLQVHASGETFAEVTEGAWIAGLFWERSRYEWSQPGTVKATVIDSNVFTPGSIWEIRASPRDGGDWRTRRKMVSRLPLMPSSLPTSAPACPPTLSPS